MRYVKDTISRAIHNTTASILAKQWVVWDMSKIQFRELFTTKGVVIYLIFSCVRYVKDTISRAIHNTARKIEREGTLCEICQRYNFESYSQRKCSTYFDNWSCVRYVKDTISRAIHNRLVMCRYMAKLCEICQRYNFESYSQLFRLVWQAMPGCVRYVKDTISRAIHNGRAKRIDDGSVVWDMSKIQFRELFTTECCSGSPARELCEICQRYNFESYSQRLAWRLTR